jgi:hypothetical protein
MRLDQRVLAQLTGALVCLAVRRNNYTWGLQRTQALRTASAHTSATPMTTPNLLREPKRWTIRSQAWLDFVIKLQTHDTSSEQDLDSPKPTTCSINLFVRLSTGAIQTFPFRTQLVNIWFGNNNHRRSFTPFTPRAQAHRFFPASRTVLWLESSHPPIRQSQLMPALVFLW